MIDDESATSAIMSHVSHCTKCQMLVSVHGMAGDYGTLLEDYIENGESGRERVEKMMKEKSH